jgi:hypothetical protein
MLQQMILRRSPEKKMGKIERKRDKKTEKKKNFLDNT